MQVNATLIAAQQAAREAQARFAQTHNITHKAGVASFASALTELGAASAKPAAAPAPQAPQASQTQAHNTAEQAQPGHTRPGTYLNIVI